VLVYFVLWQPAHNAVQKLHLSVPVMYMEAERLRTQAGEVEMLRHRPKPAMLDALALKAAIEDSALRHNLREAISTLDLQQPNAVRLSFAVVSFEQWLQWLQALQQEQHIRADSVSVAMLPQSGMVKISATLINGGSQ
jgi:general secretion pathway protein M